MSESLAMTLRRLGETADGARNDAPKLVSHIDGSTLTLAVVTTAQFNDDRKPGGPNKYTAILDDPPPAATIPFAAFDEIVFRKGGVDIACVTSPTDSLFWTDSSFEKFLFGYYEQLRIFPEQYLADLKRDLRDPWMRPLIIAVKHDSPSHSSPLAPGSTCAPPPPNQLPGLYYCAPDFASFNDSYPWMPPEQFRQIFRDRMASGSNSG
jgi:hypothetical protein